MEKPTYEQLEQQVNTQAESIAEFHVHQNRVQQLFENAVKEVEKLKALLEAQENLKETIAKIIDNGMSTREVKPSITSE